jgi:hypothetical protein
MLSTNFVKYMLSLAITNEQVLSLLTQLPVQQSTELLLSLAERAQSVQQTRMNAREQVLRRRAAERGLVWETMSDDERIALVDRILHEA